MSKEGSKRQAVGTLSHYFRTVFEAAGIKWNGDNEAEIESIVDNLIEAAGPDEYESR